MKESFRRFGRQLLRALPALWAAIVDISITAVHQDPNYWRGDLALVNEANPIGNLLMRTHVYGLFIISGVWLVLIVIFTAVLPKILSRIFVLAVLISHTFAATTWLRSRYGLPIIFVMIIVTSIIYVLCDTRNFTRQNRSF